MRRIQLLVLGLAISWLIAACGKQENSDESAPGAGVARAPDLHVLLADESRPAADRSRDAGRRPAEVIAFLGIEPGMRVIDVIAAGGYYTEVLSLAVGPDGHVIAHNTDRVLQFRDGANEKAISERLANNRLPNVTRLNKNFDAMSPSDGPFDAGITALNFHDIYNGSGADAAVSMLQTIASVLKPGGVFGIIDHAGVAGADNTQLHRIEVEKVIATAEAAGFIVESRSDLLRNAADDHTQGVFAEGLRGNTDRFLLKLRKPGE